MGENVLKLKSFGFAVRVVRLSQHLQVVKKEYVLSRQLLRCGTSVGAMIREAEHAESKADFIHKMAVAQKEVNEAIYWLELMTATDYLTLKESESLLIDAVEILKLLISTINNNQEQPEKLTINH